MSIPKKYFVVYEGNAFLFDFPFSNLYRENNIFYISAFIILPGIYYFLDSVVSSRGFVKT